MRKRFLPLYVGSLFVGAALFAQGGEKLWYRQPARTWNEALPVGNGRLGAMVFGNTGEERIQMNEGSLWSGGPMSGGMNPAAPAYLPRIRKVLLEEVASFDSATALAKKMQGRFTESFLPLADLFIHQIFRDSAVSSYYRDLDISDAVATTRFTADETVFTRQVFASAPDQVLVIRLTADKPGALNFSVRAGSLLRSGRRDQDGMDFVLAGKAPAHVDPSYYNPNDHPVVYEDSTGCRGMRFEFRIRPVLRDGRLRSDSAGLHISGATEVLLLVSAATSFNGYDKCPDSEGRDEHALAQATLDAAAQKSFSELLQNHEKDFHRYFDRVVLRLTDSAASRTSDTAATDTRLIRYSAGAADPGLESKYFQFGRYLLISCSRPGGTAANLQGLWNQELRPPWSSNYTININTQMNYWPAEETALPEMQQPLVELVRELSVTGAVTAKEFYGMKGWVAHHNTDLWGLSNPVGDFGHGDPKWANWNQGGNWLCRQLWEHYAYTCDTTYLRTVAYPLLKQAAVFCLDALVSDHRGYLVTVPSFSPENVYRYAPGKTAEISVATTMDMSVIRDLFANLTEAARILRTDEDFRALLSARRAKLFPLQIGRRGNLQEWSKDWDDEEVQHRHVSHLFGLYPGKEISVLATPRFAAAVKRSLEIRGDAGTGWSRAWKINLWARLLDGDHAYRLLRQLLQAMPEDDAANPEAGGTYPNLFDACPPFQIDGNFGGTAGITEMLLQSQLDQLQLLPALPAAWPTGMVSGLKARGNFAVTMQWKDQRLTGAVIVSLAGTRCRLRTKTPVKVAGVSATETKDDNGYLTSFPTQKGKTYRVLPR